MNCLPRSLVIAVGCGFTLTTSVLVAPTLTAQPTAPRLSGTGVASDPDVLAAERLFVA